MTTSRLQGMNHSGDDEGGSTEWGTPDSLFQPYHEIYDFTLDPAASHFNAKTVRYCTPEGTYGPDACTCGLPVPLWTPLRPSVVQAREYGHEPACSLNGLLQVIGEVGPRRLIDYRDGLTLPWAGERVWLNPPWGKALPEWLRKTRDEHLRAGVLAVVALPARTDNAWYHDFVHPYARVTPRRGRVAYVDPEAEERKSRGLAPRTGPPVGTMIATYR